MRHLKKWVTYKRNGVIYVQFKDKISGKKITAKSTGTRDEKEAEEIIQNWYYNPDSFFNDEKDKRTERVKILKRLIKELDLSDEEFISILKENFPDLLNLIPTSEKNTDTEKAGCIQKDIKKNLTEENDDGEDEDVPEGIAEIKKIKNLTFKDYLFLFWDYEKSPYIKHLYELGKTPPNPERFSAKTITFTLCTLLHMLK